MISLSLHKSLRGVGILELNSPSNRNALSTRMLEQMQAAIQSIEQDPKIRVVVLQSSENSSTTPVFCAGHDLKEISHFQSTNQMVKLKRVFNACSRVMTSITFSSKPYIAKVNGIATAAGCQLVASCDLAYATIGNSKFATPGVNVGLFCSTPGVALGRSVARKHAMELLLTGTSISAKSAQEIGLINRAVDSAEELDNHVRTIAATIASKSGVAISKGKPGFATQMESSSLSGAYELASQLMAENCLTEECREGIDAFLSKRNPSWEGSEGTV